MQYGGGPSQHLLHADVVYLHICLILHVFMLLMEHYLLRSAWAGWEEKGWPCLLRLQDLSK